MYRINLRAIFAAVTIAFTVTALAKDDSSGAPLLGPINSDPLTVRGISPRVNAFGGFNGTRSSLITSFGYRW